MWQSLEDAPDPTKALSRVWGSAEQASVELTSALIWTP